MVDVNPCPARKASAATCLCRNPGSLSSTGLYLSEEKHSSSADTRIILALNSKVQQSQ